MVSPIFITSPKNRYKVVIGWFDDLKREARFRITEKRFFQKANAFGIDESVFRRKSIQWCRMFQFELWDKRVFRIKKEDFMANCWIYPGKSDGVANGEVFDPKLVITIEKAEKLKEKPKTEEEKLKELAFDGTFG
jgi:hypothetical protein